MPPPRGLSPGAKIGAGIVGSIGWEKSPEAGKVIENATGSQAAGKATTVVGLTASGFLIGVSGGGAPFLGAIGLQKAGEAGEIVENRTGSKVAGQAVKYTGAAAGVTLLLSAAATPAAPAVVGAIGYQKSAEAGKAIENWTGSKTAGRAAEVAGKTASGLLIGAAVGSVIPVVGTGIGAGVGAAIGFISSFW